MTSSPRPLHPVRVSALLTAVLVALAWAGNATAGCGDHVVVLKPAGAKQTTDEAPPPTAPCNGPNCHAEPPSNPLPAPVSSGTIPTSSAKDQFTPIDPSPTDPRTAVGCPFDFSSPRPIHRASSIFHPPRV